MADPAEGNTPANTSAPGAPPPAAEIVIESDANEADAAELVRLKRENAEEKRLRKERETRISELEDENHRLKTPPASATPAKEKRAPSTFFDESEE